MRNLFFSCFCCLTVWVNISLYCPGSPQIHNLPYILPQLGLLINLASYFCLCNSQQSEDILSDRRCLEVCYSGKILIQPRSFLTYTIRENHSVWPYIKRLLEGRGHQEFQKLMAEKKAETLIWMNKLEAWSRKLVWEARADKSHRNYVEKARSSLVAQTRHSLQPIK